MLSDYWNRFVAALAIMVVLGAVVLAGGPAYPRAAIKFAVFAAFAVGFLGWVIGALFIHRD